MSSVLQKEFNKILHEHEHQDFYEQLFSNDSDENSNEDASVTGLDSLEDNLESEGARGFRILNIKESLRELDLEFDMEGDTRYVNDDNSDMSISSGGSMIFIDQETLSVDKTIEDMEVSNIQDTSPLSDSQIHDLLIDNSKEILAQKNKILDETININNSSQESVHEDVIGTFNIQNKYDHGAAAQLFLDGKFTFLCLQEPHASHSNIQETWKSCRRLELNSARITCHETHHQIILYDAWKWGGKVISNFESEMDGRIVYMAFQFESGEKLGIISIYALARGGSLNADLTEREKLRQTTVTLVKRQHSKWLRQYPNIKIMIMGDMQETVSTTNKDNMGKSRFTNNTSNGIVRAFQKTHVSVARERSGSIPYITRVGREGGRGIDHILFPDNPDAQALIKDAQVHECLGLSYFPSDHRLVTCTYYRAGDNNNLESMEPSIKYEFAKISKIKVRRCYSDGKTSLELDNSTFKGSVKFREQQDLYAKLQKLTGDDGSASAYHMDEIEQKIKNIYSSLWQDTLHQQCCGIENKLVTISDRQAAELSDIVNRYDYAIKDTMTFLELTKTNDCLANKAIVRNNLRLKQNFKLFENLPISTKLRYIRGSIQASKRGLKGFINVIRAKKLASIHGTSNFSTEFPIIFKKWNKLLDTFYIEKQASKLLSAYTSEADERCNHIQAIHHAKNTGNTFSDTKFLFQNIPQNTVKLINHWLQESNCSQGFHSKSPGNRFDFLKTDISAWKSHLTEATSIIEENLFNKFNIGRITQGLGDAIDDLEKLESKVSMAQRVYKADTIHYLLNVNKIEDFTRKINPKKRDAPATHTEIWDKDLNKYRTCRNDKEELIATGQFHGRWMSNSSAKEVCAFAKVRHEGKLGARGITLQPDRKVTLADIPKLINGGSKLPWKVKQAFLKAHESHTAELFRTPKEAHTSLYYPFFMQSEEGNMSGEKEYEDTFWKSLSTIPGKARYEGFHLAVIGRFGRRWQQCLYDITKLILMMRYIPRKLKNIARFPIPKPGRVNEYRPISLCNDLYCFINAVSTLHSSRGIEKANILHEGITAYVKGKGCSTLVGVEQGLREDCIESGIPTSQTDEDEEKFFDRIPVEILLAAMKLNGFPDQGFLELKASGMEAKMVEIITAKGVAHARFVCGLEQGNPDSPTVSNLVIKFKHDIWRTILKEIDIKNRNDPKLRRETKNDDAYRFHIIDPLDGEVLVDRIGYCDDNTRYTSSLNEQDVLVATRKFIQRAGDLSLVTKIGRKGSKSEIHYFNLKAETALQIEKINSLAWSFSEDAPKFEQVPFKIALQPTELEKVFQLTKFADLDHEKQDEILHIFQSKPHKHLGLKSTLTGITTAASEEVIHKIHDRIKKLNLYALEAEAQQIAANMLCTTVHSYATLQMNHNSQRLEECDNTLVKQISKRHGLSLSDSKHSLFLDKDRGGFGFKSFLDVDIIATLRELEIVLNGFMLDSKVSRSRLRAYKYENEKTKNNITSINFIANAVKKIAKYGFHIRDKYDGTINYVFQVLNQQQRYLSLGHAKYRNSDSYSMGEGKSRSLDIAYGGDIHTILRKAINENTNQWHTKEDLVLLPEFEIATSIRRLEKLTNSEKHRQFEDKAILYNFWEWNANEIGRDDYRNVKRWKYVNVMTKIRDKYPNTFWKLTSNEIFLEAQRISSMLLMESGILQRLRESEGPAMLATDGSHTKGVEYSALEDTSHSTTSAAVVCIPNLSKTETWESGVWIERAALPIYARANKLPKFFGVHKTDISHGEGIAVCLALEIMCHEIPGILVMDSIAVRNAAMKIRNRECKGIVDRDFIRKLVPGIGKCIGSRIENVYNYMEKMRTRTKDDKVDKFMNLCENWTSTDDVNEQTTNENGKTWSKKYWDGHDIFPILKVDSHQLQTNGLAIKSTPRYSKLLPNLFLLNCNHHADVCAGLMLQPHFHKENIPSIIHFPDSNLRFSIVWGGRGIDKHVSEFAHKMIQEERVKRLRNKDTQGLLWRVVTTKAGWEELKPMKRLVQSLKGFTRTHTRSVYKSELYREHCIHRKLQEDIFRENNPNVCKITKNQWNNILAPCSWCENTNKSKGNRFHAIHFCEHVDLSKFRLQMSQLLERKLFEFIKFICDTQSQTECEHFLDSVESLLSTKLHKITEIPEEERHRWYRTRNQWMEEEGNDTWTEMTNSTVPIFSHIFGFQPVMELDMKSDKDLNSAMCISLGVIPVELEKLIKNMAMGIRKYSFDEGWCKEVASTYDRFWGEIKEIHWAKLMGLHSIVGSTSKKMEIQFKKEKKTSLKQETGKIHVRQTGVTGQQLTSILKTPSPTVNTSLGKRKRVKFRDSITPHKLCKGITCDVQHNKLHCLGPTVSKIPFNKKHCQRCSRQHTALRKGAETLSKCKELQTESEISSLVQHLDENANNMQYTSTLTKLEKGYNQQKTTKANGNRVTDTQKTLIKTISNSITRMTSRTSDPHARIQQAIQNLSQADTSTNNFLKVDQQRNIHDERNLPTPESEIQKTTKVIRSNYGGEVITIKENVWKSNKEHLLIWEDRRQTIAKGNYMSSRAMHRAVVNIRLKAPVNTYVAVPAASSIILSLAEGHSWEDFAMIFRSITVSNTKPNGTYLIPIFSGEDTRGHWSLVVVNKAFKSRKMWIIDSLGSGDKLVTAAIKKAFSIGRLKCRIMENDVRRQTEVECGPRTVIGMVSICDQLRLGAEIEVAIRAGGLDTRLPNGYDSENIRRKAAEWVLETENSKRQHEERDVLFRRYRSRGRKRKLERGGDGATKGKREKVECITID